MQKNTIKNIVNLESRENLKQKINIKNKINLNTQKGITLIALVVTIIVLLILAGVSINIVLGDRGILNYAKDSGDKMGMAVVKEKIETLIVNWKADKIVDSSVTVDRFWYDLEKAEIIDNKETDVSDPISSTEPDGTKKDIYEIETTDGYIVEIIVTEEPDGEINISIGDVELNTSTTPKVKIANLTSTETSITVSVSTKRMEGGTLTYSYREKDSDNWTEWTDSNTSNSQTIKTEITITTGIEKNKIYEIKVVAQNNGETSKSATGEISTDKTAPQYATATFDKTEVDVEDKVIATITLKDDGIGVDLSKSKYVFKNSNETITDENEFKNTLSNLTESGTTATGTLELIPTKEGEWYLHILTVDKAGNKTITVIEQKITAEKVTDWEEMHKIAKAISDKYETGEITKASETATVTVDGVEHTLNVGDVFVLKDTSGSKYNVMIIGFNHDKLTNINAYDESNEYAGITFEFVEPLLNNTKLSNNATNEGGWEKTSLKTTLNNTTVNTLENNNYIKNVEKSYISSTSEKLVEKGDYKLWLLSCSEIWDNGSTDGNRTNTYGYAVANESTMYDDNDKQTQYKYYVKNIGSTSYDNHGIEFLQKKYEGNRVSWWLRSPYWVWDGSFCFVNPSTSYRGNSPTNTKAIVPCFCI